MFVGRGSSTITLHHGERSPAFRAPSSSPPLFQTQHLPRKGWKETDPLGCSGWVLTHAPSAPALRLRVLKMEFCSAGRGASAGRLVKQLLEGTRPGCFVTFVRRFVRVGQVPLPVRINRKKTVEINKGQSGFCAWLHWSQTRESGLSDEQPECPEGPGLTCPFWLLTVAAVLRQASL